jgi:hypothetical protein
MSIELDGTVVDQFCSCIHELLLWINCTSALSACVNTLMCVIFCESTQLTQGYIIYRHEFVHFSDLMSGLLPHLLPNAKGRQSVYTPENAVNTSILISIPLWRTQISQTPILHIFIPEIKYNISNNKTKYSYSKHRGIFSFLVCLHSVYYSMLYSDSFGCWLDMKHKYSVMTTTYASRLM